MKFQVEKQKKKKLRSHSLFNLQLINSNIGNALFTNALFANPAKFQLPNNAASTSNDDEKSCSITVRDMLNMNKVRPDAFFFSFDFPPWLD